MECIHCGKVITNKGSLVSHEIGCANNPNRVQHKRGVDYHVTGNDTVGLKVYRQLGDVDMTGVNVGYTRLF